MSISVGLLVVALGAIFTFAVRSSPSGIDLHVVGVVLMTIGAIGIYLRMMGYGPDTGVITLPRWWRPRTRIVEEEVYDPMAEDPTVYRSEVDATVVHRPAPTVHPVPQQTQVQPVPSEDGSRPRV
jgi:hypothetical protein